VVFRETIRPTGMFRSLPAQWQAWQREAGPRSATRKPAGYLRGAACQWSHPSLALRSKVPPAPALPSGAIRRRRHPQWQAEAPHRLAAGLSVRGAVQGAHRATNRKLTRTTLRPALAKSQLQFPDRAAETVRGPHRARFRRTEIARPATVSGSFPIPAIAFGQNVEKSRNVVFAP